MADDTSLDIMFGLLAHPQRRAMTGLIARANTIAYAKVVSALKLRPDVASKHLGCLRRAELVACTKRDGVLECAPGPGLAVLEGWIDRLLFTLPDNPEQCAPLDEMFQLLSDAGRRRLLEAVRGGPATVGALATTTRLRPDAASRKIKALAAAGCIRTDRRGREILCSLNAPALVEAWDWAYFTLHGHS